jgi:large subunit ribosomal protein L24
MEMESMLPRKQRKELYNAPLHKKRKWISSHLEEKLLLKYDKRSISVIKGDTVKVMRGSFRGHEDKVAGVNVRDGIIEIEGITMSKADGKKITKPIHASNVMITKLNLTDKWRRKKLERGLTEEAKKEVEKEAETQLKEAEEEKKKKEDEEKLLKEKEEAAGKEEEIEEVEKEPKEKQKVEEIQEEKTPLPKAEKKHETPKEKPVKKTTTKTTEEKVEENK